MQQIEFLALVLRRKWLLLGSFTVTAAVYLIILGARPREFTSEALLRFHDQPGGVMEGTRFAGVRLYDPVSEPVLRRLIETPPFRGQVREALMERGAAHLANRWRLEQFKLRPVDDGAFLKAEYLASSRTDVQPLLAATIQALKRASQGYFERSLSEGRQRVHRQLMDARSILDDLDARLVQLAGEAELPVGDESRTEQELVRSVEALDLKRLEAEEKAAALRERLHTVIPEVPQDREGILAALEGSPVYSVIQDLSNQVIRAELEVVDAQRKFTPLHPALQNALANLAAEKDVLATMLSDDSPLAGQIHAVVRRRMGEANAERKRIVAELLVAENRVAGVQRLKAEKLGQLARLRNLESKTGQLEEERKRQRGREEELHEGVRQLDLLAQCASEILQVFRAPGASRTTGRSMTALAPAVMTLAVLVALGTCYVFEVFDHRLHNQHDLRRHSGLPLLGTIPSVDTAEGELPPPGQPPAGGQPVTAILKKIVHQLGTHSVVLVTSPEPEAGKSFFAATLGICAGRQGLKTLVVDCDFRRPRLATLFDRPPAPGLVEGIVSGFHELREGGPGAAAPRSPEGCSVRPWEVPFEISRGGLGVIVAGRGLSLPQRTGYAKLSVVTAGRAIEDPTELLAAASLQRFIDAARQEFELCIIDTPPLGAVADSLLLASNTDAVILVLRAEHSTGHGLRWARQGLEDVGARVLGTVLNGLHRRLPGYYTYEAGRKVYRASI